MPSRESPNIPATELVNLVFAYLQGEPISLVRKTLHETCHTAQRDAKTLYKSIAVTPALREQLFKLLCVPKKIQHLYLHEHTLFTLLVRLHQDGYGYQHLDFLLTIIQGTKYTYGWKKRIAIALFAALGLGAWAYDNRDRLAAIQQFLRSSLPRILRRFLAKTAFLLRNIPLVGIVYTAISLLWNIYATFYHGFSNLNHKLTVVSFKLLSKGLVLSAYIACFLAAGVVAPLTGLLFVAGAAIDIIESFALFLLIRLKPLPQQPPQTWEEQADYARQDNQRKHATSTIWVNAGAAVLTTVVVAIWCFFPPSIFLTLGCIGATIAIGLLKSHILEHINTVYATSLQTTLKSIPKTTDKADEASDQEQANSLDADLDAHPAPRPCNTQTYSVKQHTTPNLTSVGRSFATFFSQKETTHIAATEETMEHDATCSM